MRLDYDFCVRCWRACGRGAFVNTHEDAKFWAATIQEHGVKSEIECFDVCHPWFDFVLGIKNTIPYSPKEPAAHGGVPPYRVLATNAQLVERAVRIAGELQRKVATPAEARLMLRIKNS